MKRPCTVPDGERQKVRGHINSFPKHTSHYSRQSNPNRCYLQGVSSVAEMYALCVASCEQTNEQPVKEHLYRNIFNYEFNLSFKLPRSDTCKACDHA